METWLTYGLQDFILFSPDVYFGLFQQANEAAWPFVLLFPCVGGFIAWTVIAGRFARMGGVLLVLCWVGAAFLFLKPFYLPINWAVTYALYAFAAQAVLLLLTTGAEHKGGKRTRAGYVLMAAAVLYPLFAPLFGKPLMQAQVFALAPDPTAIFTLGYLLQLRGWRTALVMPIPLLWCAFSTLTLYALNEPVSFLPPATAALIALFSLTFRLRS